MCAQAEDQHGAGKREDGGGGEGGLHVESAPEGTHEEAGDEVADGVDGGERSEGHAVLLLGHELGGKGILQGFFGADVKAREDSLSAELVPEEQHGMAFGT